MLSKRRIRIEEDQEAGVTRFPSASLDEVGDHPADPGRQPELDLVVMDGYSQAAYGEPSEGATFAALQRLARERDVAVLVTAHLTPDENAPETDPPALSDLRSMEGPVAEARNAVLLHRPDRSGTVAQRRGEVDLIAARGWQDTGSATVRFEPEYHRFVDLPNT